MTVIDYMTPTGTRVETPSGTGEIMATSETSAMVKLDTGGVFPFPLNLINFEAATA